MIQIAKRNIHTEKLETNNHTKFSIEFWTGEVASVNILSFPTDAVQTLARVTRGYTGNYLNEPCPWDMVSNLFSDLKNTKLGTPAEMLYFVFLIRDVPRSFTHQLVRTRLASVVQESTRFIGSCEVYKILVPNTLVSGTNVHPHYIEGTVKAIEAYANLVEQPGIASQDARNLLPHSLLTHLFWGIGLKSLMTVYEQRWCCQAEPSTWLPVMRQIKQLIKNACGTQISNLLTSPITRGEDCGFHASFDRPCSWRTDDNSKV